MALAAALRSLMLKWAFTADSVTRPTTWYAQLHTGDPGAAGTSNVLPLTNGHSRQAITLAESGQNASNTNKLTFGPVTGSDWAAATHLSIWDASTSGTFYAASNAFPVAKTGQVNDSIIIEIGDLDIPFT